jgi:hypothetical protein
MPAATGCCAVAMGRPRTEVAGTGATVCARADAAGDEFRGARVTRPDCATTGRIAADARGWAWD